MAVRKPEPKRKPIAEVRKENEKLTKLVETGIRCIICDKLKPAENNFYRTTEPYNRIHYTCVCKECVRKIAAPKDDEGIERPTEDTIKIACQLLNKPFIRSLYETSVIEANNESVSNLHDNPWTAYIKNVSMNQYNGMVWTDSDEFGGPKVDPLFKAEKPIDKKVKQMLEEHKGQDTYDSFLKNKEDIIRLIDYDPFEGEMVEDQPFLYAQLVGLLDNAEESNEEMFRTNSAITIARTFLQAKKIDDTIAQMTRTLKDMEKNAAVIKNLQDTKKNALESARKLAEESCLTVKNSKNSVKGSNTWTGKIKKIKDMGIREAMTNGFDINTCKGMQQVQEISDASIMKQLALDDSDWSDMVAEMRTTIVSIRQELAQYKEINRLLLRENIDLKDYCEDSGIDINMKLVDLKNLYSVFADLDDTDIDEEDYDEEDISADGSSI